MKYRDPNTDLIRASAIALVLIHHIGVFLPQLPDTLKRFLALGAFGVDLFFVLSGWLIGGIYWREKKSFGSVDTLHFWLRRWIRTIPPYLAVLAIAYLAVYFFRGEKFDWRYLVFAQNYEVEIPFFLVSWSLCVEEHFYFFFPLSILLFARMRIPVQIVLPTIVLLSIFIRFLDSAALPSQPFGYSTTASHLRFSGLAIGVWFAYLSIYDASTWEVIQKKSIKLLTPLVLGFFTLPFWTNWFAYYLSYSFVAVFWGVVLAALTAIPSLRIAAFPATHFLALTSYSLYLTNSLAIHASINVTDRLNLTREFAVPFWLMVILLTGFVAYMCVERPAILFRDRMASRRM